jgi:ABC-type glycerol-3-phosphate transport system permease component
MGIISQIGRKSKTVRTLVFSMYVVLILGALTMVYPFCLMMAGSSKSAVDRSEMALIPGFLKNDTELYRKSVEGFFNERTVAMITTYGVMKADFKKLEFPDNKKVNYNLEGEWRDFIEKTEVPFYAYGLFFINCPVSRQTVPLKMREFKAMLYDKYNGSIEAMNRDLASDFPAWHALSVRPQTYLARISMPNFSKFMKVFYEFKIKQPKDYRYYFSVEGFYKAIFLKALYTKKIASYNASHGTKFDSWTQVKLPRRYPAGKEFTGKQRLDWLDFTRNLLNVMWLRADKEAAPLFRKYLQVKYDNKINVLNNLYNTKYASFEQIMLFAEPPLEGRQVVDWTSFIQGWRDPKGGKLYILPKELMSIHSIDFMFRDHLMQKYGSLGRVNRELGSKFTSTLEIFPPQRERNYYFIQRHKNMLRWEFVKRNFVSVANYIILHGRGVLNTFIYCGLAIFCALIVNPLAAYALSRYKPPSQYKILLFLMLTMAFPPMVMQIPNFLMLRELGLLNTFAALILPGLANGYSIFLLKGFFDSLPRELYESAMLDGAGEIRIFWQLTMNLSKPILAVIALTAFKNSYANFMMALLICQDEKMWTLMPWLYQLQQKSGEGVIFSSLLIAAVPTFLVFALCQNVIMRGIVVPVEK